VVACSASINSNLRNDFQRKQWVVNPLHVDTTGSLSLPNTLKHSAYVVQSDGLYFFDWSKPEEHNQVDIVEDSSKDVIGDKGASENIKADEKVVETNDDSGKESNKSLDKTEDKKGTALADDDPLVVESIKYLIEQGKFSSGFIFTSSSISVRKLVANLQSVGLDALRFIDIRNYEEKSQSNNITSEKSLPNWLVLTEHEARGLDLPTASTVFILGPPSSPQSYLHMAGRVGRAGRTGNVVSLLGGPVYERKFRSVANILKLSPV
jgi:superfamily II DNA/RNA helicase